MKPPEKEEIFKEWIESKDELKDNIQFLAFQNPPKSLKFLFKKEGVFSRTISEILKQINYLENQSKQISEKLDTLCLTELPNCSQFLCFENNSQNLKIRFIYFLKKERHSLMTELYTNKYVKIRNKICDLNQLLSFIEDNYVPQSQVIQILPKLYEIKDDKTSETIMKKIKILDMKINELELLVNCWKKPLWVKDFDSFFLNVIKEAHPHMDREISYFKPFQLEVELSRAIFHSPNERSLAFDEVVSKVENKEVFGQELITLCYGMMPKKGTIPRNLQSVALLLL